MAPADRLSALDGAFLDLDHPDAPLHVGVTVRAGGAPPSLAGLRRHLDARLDLVPALRRRVLTPPAGLGDAVWADDPGFDIARHVHAVAAPAPGGAADLAEVAGALLSVPLAPGRPLWQMTMVTGLRDGWAIVGQLHHVLLDGVAGMRVAVLLLSDGDGRPAADWTPRPAPSARRVSTASAAGSVRAGARALSSAPAAASAALEAGARAPGVARRMAGASTSTALDATSGPGRTVGYAHLPLQEARLAGRRQDATVNDVLLAATALALRRALARRHEHHETVRALVPVDVREAGDGALGNRISFIACELPVGSDDPVRVLRRVRRQTRRAKDGGEASPLAALAHAADALPAAARGRLARALAGRLSFTTIVSNVPGPEHPLTLLGRPVRSLHPAVPLLHGHAVSVGAVSYAGVLHVGVYADAGLVPDADLLAADLDQAFAALVRADRPAPTPWQERARTRRAGAPAATARAGGRAR